VEYYWRSPRRLNENSNDFRDRAKGNQLIADDGGWNANNREGGKMANIELRKFSKDEKRCSYKCPFYVDGPVMSSGVLSIINSRSMMGKYRPCV